MFIAGVPIGVFPGVSKGVEDRSHLTGRGFIPAGLPLTGPRCWRLSHRLISSICAWSLSPTTTMPRGLSFRFRCFVPAVFADTSSGSPMPWCGMARCVSTRSGSASWCVAGSGVPHSCTRSCTWSLAALRPTRGFIPSAV